MLTDQQNKEEQMPVGSPCNYSPVTVTVSDSIGAIFLGILSVILLIGWRRAETRYRQLATQYRMTNHNDFSS